MFSSVYGKQITILDGGMGRELMRRGESVAEPLWSANALFENPDAVRTVHIDFLNAGAEIVTANTYGLKPSALRQCGRLADHSAAFAMAIKIAREAIDACGSSGAKIAASLPPLATTYRADLVQSLDTLLDEYRTMVRFSQDCGVDIILGETLSSAREGEAILAVSQDCGIPIWISFTVQQDGRLRSGELASEAGALMVEGGAQALLLNCSTPESITRALIGLNNSPLRVPVGAYANLFPPVQPKYEFSENGPNPLRDELKPAVYVEHVQTWINQGAVIVGGCCGVGPEYIGAVRASLQ